MSLLSVKTARRPPCTLLRNLILLYARGFRKEEYMRDLSKTDEPSSSPPEAEATSIQ